MARGIVIANTREKHSEEKELRRQPAFVAGSVISTITCFTHRRNRQNKYTTPEVACQQKTRASHKSGIGVIARKHIAGADMFRVRNLCAAS